MALFQTEATSSGGINYKSMGKDQLIMLLQSQKSDIDALNRKLVEASAAVEEKNRLAQMVASLSAENELLKTKAADLELKLSARKPEEDYTEIGSLADKAVHVSGVMQAAQKAADEYLAEIKRMHDTMSREFNEYEFIAKQKADAILKQAQAEADTTTQKARMEANEIWSALQTRLNGYIADKKQ